MEPISWDALKARGQIINLADINPDEDYFVLGHRDTRRSSYQWTDYPLYLVKAGDLIGNQDQTAFYEHDLTTGGIINVNTTKGVIELKNFNIYTVSPGLGNAAVININNTTMDYSNADKVYLQLTPYYKKTGDDNFIPYVLPTGYVGGSDISIYNLSSAAAGTQQQTGLFYLYYETFNF